MSTEKDKSKSDPQQAAKKQRPARPPHKPKKKGNGEGTCYEDVSKGCWFAAVPIGRAPNGKIKVKKVRAVSETDAKAKLRQLQSEKLQGLLVDPSKMTFADTCARWQEQRIQVRASTRERSEQHLQHVIEVLGDRKIQSIKTEDITKLFGHLSQKPMAHGKAMAPISLRHIRTHLWSVFEYAVEEGLITKNPVTKRIKIGKVDAIGGRPLSAEQVSRLRDVGVAFYRAGLLRLWPAIATAVWTGLRRGEIFALTWEDVNLDEGVIHVRHAMTRVKTAYVSDDPKTQSSKRKLPLHGSLISILQEHLREQQRHFKQGGMAWSKRTPVFATTKGGFTSPDNMYRSLKILLSWADPANLRPAPGQPDIWRGVKTELRPALKAIVSAGEALPEISPHDLRHTYATLMLRRGGQLEVVSQLLGHADPVITLRVYRKVASDELEVARRIDISEATF